MSAVALSADESGILLNAAGAAPSMHNTQPWRFEVAGHVVDVLLDEERTLPAEDPAGRMIRVGLGAAAFNVRVAAAMLGYDADHAIAPDPERPEIVVRVFLGERHDRSYVAELYPEVHRRRTYRGPMLELQIAPAVRTVIGAAARDEGAGLTWLNGGARDRLLGAVLEADLLDAYDDERHAERTRWIGGHRERDGVPEETIGPQPARYPAPHRDLGADAPPRATAEFESRPQVAVLTTTADGPDDWVLAGMALQHALLVASSYDVSASFVNQPLEHAETRQYVRALVPAGHYPQLIARFGYPATPGGRRAPRRPWQETVDDPE